MNYPISHRKIKLKITRFGAVICFIILYMNNDDIPNKGSYCLIIYVKNDCKIKIGAKGLISFPVGVLSRTPIFRM